MIRTWLCAALLLAGCDDHLVGESSEEVVDGELVYTSDWAGAEDLFSDRCDVCHNESGGSGGFDLHVKIEAELNGGVPYLVVPGDADASVLWQALSGTGADVPAMPPGSGLQEEFIGHVRDWINNGAEQ